MTNEEKMAIYQQAREIVTAERGPRPTAPKAIACGYGVNAAAIGRNMNAVVDAAFAAASWDRRVREICVELEEKAA